MRYNEIKKGNMVDLSGIELPEAYEYLKSATIGVYYPMHEVEFMHLDKTGRGYKGTEIPFSHIHNEEHIKICSCCGEYMTEGYVINGGEEYYCNTGKPEINCLNSVYTFDQLCSMGIGDDSTENYYTKWDDIDTDDNGQTLQSFIAKCEVGDTWETQSEKYIRTK